MNSILGKSGQTAVPSGIRKQFDLEPGSKLHWESDGGRILVYPVAKDPVNALVELFKGKGSVVNHLLTERRKDRAREDRQVKRVRA